MTAGGNVIGHGHAGSPIVLSHKAAFQAEPRIDEAIVSNNNSLQIFQLLNAELTLSGFTYDPSPSFDSVVWWGFPFDSVRRF